MQQQSNNKPKSAYTSNKPKGAYTSNKPKGAYTSNKPKGGKSSYYRNQKRKMVFYTTVITALITIPSTILICLIILK